MTEPTPKTQPKVKSSQSDNKELTKKELQSFIEEQVITKLGKPKELDFIRSGNVFDNRWRVDVWCYFDSMVTIMAIKSSKIKHSYFIRVDEHGKIIDSSPEINKEY
jgi:hypothetical protein